MNRSQSQGREGNPARVIDQMASKRTYVFPRAEEFTTIEFLRLNGIVCFEYTYSRFNEIIEQAGYERIITPRRFDVPQYKRYTKSGADKRWRRTERAVRFVAVPKPERTVVPPKGAPYSLRAPDGTIHQGTNLAKFVREHAEFFAGCTSAHTILPQLRPGMRGHVKSWRGWTWHTSNRSDGMGHWPKGKPRSSITEARYAQFMRALKRDNLSAREIARRTGRDPKTVWKWLTGKIRPTEETAKNVLATIAGEDEEMKRRKPAHQCVSRTEKIK